MGRLARVARAYGLLLLGFAGMFGLWHVASVFLVRSVLFPPPLSVALKAVELMRTGVIFEHVGVSLQRILSGFLLGSAVGVPVGLLMGNFEVARKLIEPYTEFFRFVPATAMITVAVIWFGIGEASKVFLIMYTTVFIVVLNTAAGVSSIAPNKIRAAQALGASSLQVFLFVACPATLPYILTGMRIAMGNSFATIVAAEMVASNSGLGYMLWTARLYMLVDEIFVPLLVLGLLGFATDRLFRILIFRFAGRYAPVV
jgi:NitT/TauT family transport system permease protein